MRLGLVFLVLAVCFAFADVIVELTASHTGPQPYPQIWQGQVSDTTTIIFSDSITKIFMTGNEVFINIVNDSTAILWSPSNRTVHIGTDISEIKIKRDH
jgi:hypothetical protein